MKKRTIEAYALVKSLTIFRVDNEDIYDTVKEWLDDADVVYIEKGTDKATNRMRIRSEFVLEALSVLSETFEIIVK